MPVFTDVKNSDLCLVWYSCWWMFSVIQLKEIFSAQNSLTVWAFLLFFEDISPLIQEDCSFLSDCFSQRGNMVLIRSTRSYIC